MRSGENPLDLNNLPDDYGRDHGKQILEDSSNSLTESSDASIAGCRKKKSGGKDECGKVYECRFCSLKFCKSQALGGHMNRHRQERETETLNRARQLVFSNDTNLAAQGGPHLGGAQVMPSNIIDSNLTYRGAYPARLYTSSSPTILSPIQSATPQPPPYLYTPSSRFMSYPDYYLGHVLPPNTHRRGPAESSYTCIGAPLGQNGVVQGIDGATTGEDGRVHNYAGTTQCYDQSSMNRFSDGL